MSLEALAAGLRAMHPKTPKFLIYVGHESPPFDMVSMTPVEWAQNLYQAENGFCLNPVNYIPVGEGIGMLERHKFTEAVDDSGGAE